MSSGGNDSVQEWTEVLADTIDFDRAAIRIAELTDIRLIRAELVQIWNARGARDIVWMESDSMAELGPAPAGRYVKSVQRRISALERPVTPRTRMRQRRPSWDS